MAADKHPGSAIKMQALRSFGDQNTAHLRTGIELSRHPMLLVDDQRRWVVANEAAEQLLAVTSRELPWRSMDEFTPPSDREHLEQQWQEFLTKGAAEGWYDLSVADPGVIRVEFSATAHVLPGRHLTVFIPQTERTAGSPVEEAAWTAVESDTERPAPLTRREREVITLIAGGGRSIDIAERLFVSPATIKSHVENAMTKLGAHTRAHAVAIALVTGQIVWSMYGVSGGVAAGPEHGDG